ncbi:hypothetical protein [Vibrio cholerae]|uniref:hypothetical protein n=1 Tax=Vibrio cholerae TaxID=666 RepID=UPI001CA359F1|nr:hypothetical protein [Vibrio cholerae]
MRMTLKYFLHGQNIFEIITAYIVIWGTRRREFKIEHIVDECEGAFAYDGALLIGAVCELTETLD